MEECVQLCANAGKLRRAILAVNNQNKILVANNVKLVMRLVRHI